MPDINTSPFVNIILERLPTIDRNATPLPGTDPDTFVASLSAVLTAGGWQAATPTSVSTVQTASPSTPDATHASASNSPVDIFELLFGQALAGRKS